MPRVKRAPKLTPGSLKVRKSQAVEAQRREIFLALLKGRVSAPSTGYHFHETRKWAFDFAWTGYKVALESEGGIWTGGAHTRGAKFTKDCEKYNEATLMGWRVLRVPSSDLCKPATIDLVRRALLHNAVNGTQFND